MSTPTTWRPPKLIANPYLRYGLIGFAILYLICSLVPNLVPYVSLDIDWDRAGRGLPRAADMFKRMVPPDFSRWELLQKGVLESVRMALAASLLGMILAIPVYTIIRVIAKEFFVNMKLVQRMTKNLEQDNT